ncbi:MAG: MarR family winged helix-turn-helix transcriptional regulator [Reyranellaceae bacterium]
MPTPPPVSDLSSHLGFWLRFVSNHVSQAFAEKLAERNVSVGEWVTLRLLYQADAMPPSRLADHLGMTRGAVTKLADRLIGKSLVVRRADSEDGRAQTLALTRQGKKLVPTLAELADRNDAEFFGHLSRDERAALRRLLMRLVDHGQMRTIPLD